MKIHCRYRRCHSQGGMAAGGVVWRLARPEVVFSRKKKWNSKPPRKGTRGYVNVEPGATLAQREGRRARPGGAWRGVAGVWRGDSPTTLAIAWC